MTSLGRLEVCLLLGDRRLLGHEQAARGHVREIGGFGREHRVLKRRVVREVGYEEILACFLDAAGAAAEIEEQIIERERRTVLRALARGTRADGQRLGDRGRHGTVETREIRAARCAVEIGGGARLGPRRTRRRIVAKRQIDDVGEREARDPRLEIGR